MELTGRPSSLAFADDLSLYLNSEANANCLLEKVLQFEHWSGLRLALSKSFVTGIMHGKGATRRTSALARDGRGGAEKPSRVHPCDRILMEDDGNDCLLVRRLEPKGIEQIRCARCLQDRSQGKFPQGASNADDNDKICYTCRSQWRPLGIIYNGHPLPIIPGSSPTRFLGIHGDMRGTCSMQISLVFQKSASIVNFLREKKLSTRHSLSLVSMTLPSYVRFPSGMISWTGNSLLKLDRLWMQAYKMACGVSRSTASCIMRFPSALGGRNLPTPLAVICETVWSHLESCCFDMGGLQELLLLEYKEALSTWDCHDLAELQRAVASKTPTWRQATTNRFIYACFLANMLNITLIWEPFPKEAIWCTPSIQLAQLLIELRAHLTIPGQDPAQRFLCLGIQEEVDTVQLRSLSGLQLTLSLNSRAGRSTSVTLRDALTINFPAVRDIHQLRAVLIGSPLCEVHGTARTDHHRQGALFNLVISEKHAPSKSPNLPTPSRTGVQGEEGTDVPVHNVPDGLPDQEAPPSTARHASRSPSMEPAAPPPQGPPLSWFGATKLLRERLQELQRRAKQGPLQHGVAMELARLMAGQEAFDKLLPKLKAAHYLDLKDLPRASRGPSESGRLNFFLPSLKGASPADLALASAWLSHRDTKDSND
jgi:hypothetical protein